MANYCCLTRTNYFSVNDPEKLRAIVSCIHWADGVLEYLDEQEGKYGFGAYSCIFGIQAKDDDSETHEPDAVYEELQKIVAPDDAIIITEIGCEKLRYLTAYSIIITQHAIECVDLRNSTLDATRHMLNASDYDTQMEY